MNQPEDYRQDLASIRNLMERSVKFVSLSGLSGILSGIYALAGVAIAYFMLDDPDYNGQPDLVFGLAAVGTVVLVFSLVTGWLLSRRKARQLGTSIWNETSKRMFINLAIPLVAGGLFIFFLTLQGYYGIVAPSLLLFYGLALVNASDNLYNEILYLGCAEIVLGLVAAAVPGYGLLLWAIGFGVLHIFYGALMYKKYDA